MELHTVPRTRLVFSDDIDYAIFIVDLSTLQYRSAQRLDNIMHERSSLVHCSLAEIEFIATVTYKLNCEQKRELSPVGYCYVGSVV